LALRLLQSEDDQHHGSREQRCKHHVHPDGERREAASRLIHPDRDLHQLQDEEHDEPAQRPQPSHRCPDEQYRSESSQDVPRPSMDVREHRRIETLPLDAGIRCEP